MQGRLAEILTYTALNRNQTVVTAPNHTRQAINFGPFVSSDAPVSFSLIFLFLFCLFPKRSTSVRIRGPRFRTPIRGSYFSNLFSIQTKPLCQASRAAVTGEPVCFQNSTCHMGYENKYTVMTIIIHDEEEYCSHCA